MSNEEKKSNSSIKFGDIKEIIEEQESTNVSTYLKPPSEITSS